MHNDFTQLTRIIDYHVGPDGTIPGLCDDKSPLWDCLQAFSPGLGRMGDWLVRAKPCQPRPFVEHTYEEQFLDRVRIPIDTAYFSASHSFNVQRILGPHKSIVQFSDCFVVWRGFAGMPLCYATEEHRPWALCFLERSYVLDGLPDSKSEDGTVLVYDKSNSPPTVVRVQRRWNTQPPAYYGKYRPDWSAFFHGWVSTQWLVDFTDIGSTSLPDSHYAILFPGNLLPEQLVQEALY